MYMARLRRVYSEDRQFGIALTSRKLLDQLKAFVARKTLQNKIAPTHPHLSKSRSRPTTIKSDETQRILVVAQRTFARGVLDVQKRGGMSVLQSMKW